MNACVAKPRPRLSLPEAPQPWEVVKQVRFTLVGHGHPADGFPRHLRESSVVRWLRKRALMHVAGLRFLPNR
jgi:hypothetical protein